MTVDMTPVRSPSRSKMPSARSRTSVASTKSGPTGDARMSSSMSAPAASSASSSFARPDRTSPANHAAPSREVDHPDLAERRGEAAIVAELLRELDGPAVGLLGTVEVDLDGARRRTTRRAGSAGAPGRARASPGAPARASPRSAARARTRRASSAAASSSWLIAERRRAPELDVELDRRIAHRLGERGQLGEAVESLAGPAEDGECVVARREEDPPVGRRRHDRQRLLDEPERLLGGIRGEGGRRGVDREARRAGGVAGRQRVLGEHRQAGRGRVATLQ